MYKVKLADGTILDGLDLNGNNFIPSILNREVFRNNLSGVTIIDPNGNVERYTNMKVLFAKIGEQETFVLLEKTREEIDRERLEQTIADLDYLSIMSGVDIYV